jgi:hypothetical protein
MGNDEGRALKLLHHALQPQLHEDCGHEMLTLPRLSTNHNHTATAVPQPHLMTAPME